MNKFFSSFNQFRIGLCGGEGDLNGSGPTQMFWLVWFNLFFWGAVMRDIQVDHFGVLRIVGFVCLSAALLLAVGMLRKIRNDAALDSDSI